MKYVETGDVSHSVQYTYDDQNKLTDLVEVINGVTHTTHYTYDDDQRISRIQNGSRVISYTYDTYGRVSQKTDGSFVYAYTYKSTSAGAPSNQIDTVSVMRNGAAVATFQYNYDDNGNILGVSNNGLSNSYTYDSAGQLLRENNKQSNKTWVWTYDDAGNILSKTEYAYTTGTLGTPLDTIVYTYGDTAWGDLLTAYDGVSITYDTMGNPLTDGTWTYTWEHGRQLASMTDGTTTWIYTYDANGMRTSRSNGTDTYSYVYNGSKLMQMKKGAYTLDFTYDASGNPSTVTLNGATYYYITNLQGDVIEIRSASGSLVCDYTYDAWGKVISRSDNSNHLIDDLNPLLYRGYVYDTDTGLYYLQSRYYDPQIGRFLNADALVSTGQGLLGNNMFAYCRNNPINRIDSSGTYDLDYFDLDGNPTTDEKDKWGRSSVGDYKGSTNSGNGKTAGDSVTDRPVSPRKVSNSALKNVDVHAFKWEFVRDEGNSWDLYKDTANNAAIWLGNKAQLEWIPTGYILEELLEYFMKGWK